ncbi:TlpA family protein disulfide reductase [Gramella sp. MT6]|uniref:peroxiredoxin family protein n=1 Tax=Gramella sp. MT6 TaxID=2705471 RepID=UPI001C5F6162|nr:peroxiredoxin family protein [Gramella sp. MT6]QYA24998.1 TlpA family protein disulfide reductase [Gramella sp. MT6]
MNARLELRRLAVLIIFNLILSFSFSKEIYAQTEKDEKETSEIDYKKEAPDFELPNLEGEIVKLQDYNDKILVLHIATTWCPFCNAEAPHLEKLYQEYKSKGVEVLIIDVKESKELVEQQLKNKHNLSFPILLDTDGSVAASFAPENILPDLARDEVMLASNLIIDQEGKIRFMSLLDSKNFDAKLLDLKAKLNELL